MDYMEVGTCEMCGKENVSLRRTYYHYDIKCCCHAPSHFEYVSHCKDCIPEEPSETKIIMLGEDGKEYKFIVKTRNLKRCR
jgi:hypothetical protein